MVALEAPGQIGRRAQHAPRLVGPAQMRVERVRVHGRCALAREDVHQHRRGASGRLLAQRNRARQRVRVERARHASIAAPAGQQAFEALGLVRPEVTSQGRDTHLAACRVRDRVAAGRDVAQDRLQVSWLRWLMNQRRDQTVAKQRDFGGRVVIVG
jgi:hypothetical protein